jgi:protein-tyrosine-phosphatase
MAEGLARACIASRRGSAVPPPEVSSAGVAALDGNPAATEAVAAMRALGIDISGHRARSVTRGLIEASDLVLAMEEGQLRSISSLRVPGPDARAFLLLKLGEVVEGDLSDVFDSAHAAGDRDRLRVLSTLSRSIERARGWSLPDRMYEVEDPLGYGVDEYSRVAAIMEPAISTILAALLDDAPPVRRNSA